MAAAAWVTWTSDVSQNPKSALQTSNYPRLLPRVVSRSWTCILSASRCDLCSALGAGSGHGEYPTIVSFDYDEEITFSHVGKPFVSYVQRTTLAATGLPAHAETGYLRAVGDDAYEFVISCAQRVSSSSIARW